MKAYFQDEKSGIVIYNCDNREISPNFDLLLTDPPFGIDHPTDYFNRGRSGKGWSVNGKGGPANCRNYPKVHGDNNPFDPTPWIQYPSIIFGAEHFASQAPSAEGYVVWDKMRPDDLDQSTAEMAWSNVIKGIRVFRYLWDGMRKQVRGAHGEVLEHPMQKPVALMTFCLTTRWTKDYKTIFDPFCGTGPVLRAAKDLGRKAVGCEISEAYCEIAARKLQQEVLAL